MSTSSVISAMQDKDRPDDKRNKDKKIVFAGKELHLLMF
jgi:hypothetical protein